MMASNSTECSARLLYAAEAAIFDAGRDADVPLPYAATRGPAKRVHRHLKIALNGFAIGGWPAAIVSRHAACCFAGAALAEAQGNRGAERHSNRPKTGHTL